MFVIQSLGLYVLIDSLTFGVAMGNTIQLQSFNFAMAPNIYSASVGVLNQIVLNVGHAFGVVFMVIIMSITDY